MQRVITVGEFITQYLRSQQWVRVVDNDCDYLYYSGRAQQLIESEDVITSARLSHIEGTKTVTGKNTIDLYI